MRSMAARSSASNLSSMRAASTSKAATQIRSCGSSPVGVAALRPVRSPKIWSNI